MPLLACYQMRRGVSNLKRLSHQLRRGIAKAFCKFDEYQFAKYKAQDKPITLRDALFIAHPKAENEQQQELFDRIARQELQTPYTWETRLSEAGQVKGLEQKRQVWTELIKSRRMGYMAMLRNLRNMLSAEVDDETMQIVYDYLSSEQAVLNSKQLPFRFLSAYLILDMAELAQELTLHRQFEQSPRYKRYSSLQNRWAALCNKRCQMESLIQQMERPFHFVEVRKVRKKRSRLTVIAKSLVELGLGNVEHWHCAERRKKRMANTRISSHRIKFIAYMRKQLAKLDRVYSIIAGLWCRNNHFAGRMLGDPVINRFAPPCQTMP